MPSLLIGGAPEVLFRAVARLQTACPSRYAWLRGRLTPSDRLGLSCPPATDPFDGWAEMVQAMHGAVARWRAEGGLPSVHITLQQYRIHPVDSSPAAFVTALTAAVRAGLGENEAALTVLPAPPRWCTVEVLAVPTPLPPGLQALLDADHLDQAHEVLQSLCPADAPDLHLRFLGELLFRSVADQEAFLLPGLQAMLGGEQTRALLRARLHAERDHLPSLSAATAPPPADADAILARLLGAADADHQRQAVLRRLLVPDGAAVVSRQSILGQ